MSRRRVNMNDEGTPNTKLSVNEKNLMRKKVESLFARPTNLILCPVPPARLAEILASFANHEAVTAVRVLKRLGESTARYFDGYRNQAFTDAGWEFRFEKRPGEDDMFFDLRNDPTRSPEGIPWSDFIDRLGDDAGPFLEWAKMAHNIRLEAEASLTAFKFVMGMCSTAGQVYRIVPEMLTFATPNTQAAFKEQKKLSAIPADYFNLDFNAVIAMNDFISKCQMMPPSSENDSVPTNMGRYDRVTWARRIDGDERRVYEVYNG